MVMTAGELQLLAASVKLSAVIAHFMRATMPQAPAAPLDHPDRPGDDGGEIWC